MPTAGPNSPAGLTTSGTGPDWAIPSRAASSNNSYTTASMVGSDTSRYLECTNFSFSFTGTVTGVEVLVERSATVATTVQISHAQLLHGGAAIGVAKNPATQWTGVDAIEIIGSGADTWGSGLTATQAGETTFGVRLAVTETGGNALTARIDHVQIRITYTDPVTGTAKIMSGKTRTGLVNGGLV